jgi:hypothetical protein
MNLKECREKYYYNSAKAGDICRTLGLAGLALIWAFRTITPTGVMISLDLRMAGLLLVIGLASDLLQYIAGTIIWGICQRHKEIQFGSSDHEFSVPGWINVPTSTFFYLKLFAVAVAYILIISTMCGFFWT